MRHTPPGCLASLCFKYTVGFPAVSSSGAARSRAPPEPMLLASLRIYFADFPELPCTTCQSVLSLGTCCGSRYGPRRCISERTRRGFQGSPGLATHFIRKRNKWHPRAGPPRNADSPARERYACGETRVHRGRNGSLPGGGSGYPTINSSRPLCGILPRASVAAGRARTCRPAEGIPRLLRFRVTRARVPSARNPAPLQHRAASARSLLRQPRSAPGARPPRLTPAASRAPLRTPTAARIPRARRAGNGRRAGAPSIFGAGGFGR